MKSHLNRMPLEDLTTELLAGILESDQNILDNFVNQILEIQGKNFSITTQKHYQLNSSESEENLTHKRPDMVFSNGVTLCFVENKVESPENENQLYLYYSILKNEESEGKSYLRYCTKYYDPKNSQDYGGEDIFKQFRWSDVSEFLFNYENGNPLIREFILFLRSFGMGKIEKFKKEDDAAMENLFSLIEKMKKCVI